MDEHELIMLLSDELEQLLDVPTRVAGFEDERPVPSVIIDDWDTQDLVFHNSTFAHEEAQDWDGDGEVEYARWHRFYFETRVEIVTRAMEETDASRLKTQVKNIVRDWSTDARDLHNDLNEIKPRNSGSPRHTFREPRESEENVTATFMGFFELVKDDFDTLEEVTKQFTWE